MTPDSLKSFFQPYRTALADFEPTAVKGRDGGAVFALGRDV